MVSGLPLTCCLCALGLLGGGYERVITDFSAAPARVWTGVPEKGELLDNLTLCAKKTTQLAVRMGLALMVVA